MGHMNSEETEPSNYSIQKPYSSPEAPESHCSKSTVGGGRSRMQVTSVDAYGE